MSGAELRQDPAWLGIREVAKRLAVHQRRVYALVEEGVLAKPTRLGFRNFWTQDDVTAAELRRDLRRRRPPKTRAPQLSRDRRELATAFWLAWRELGIDAAVAIVKQDGWGHPKDIPIGGHARLAQRLRRAANCP